jgi:inorganic triphosphatase YgiF
VQLPPEEIMRQMAKLANEQAMEACAKFAEQFANSKIVQGLSGPDALLGFAAAIRSTNAKVWPAQGNQQ